MKKKDLNTTENNDSAGRTAITPLLENTRKPQMVFLCVLIGICKVVLRACSGVRHIFTWAKNYCQEKNFTNGQKTTKPSIDYSPNGRMLVIHGECLHLSTGLIQTKGTSWVISSGSLTQKTLSWEICTDANYMATDYLEGRI